MKIGHSSLMLFFSPLPSSMQAQAMGMLISTSLHLARPIEHNWCQEVVCAYICGWLGGCVCIHLCSLGKMQTFSLKVCQAPSHQKKMIDEKRCPSHQKVHNACMILLLTSWPRPSIWWLEDVLSTMSRSRPITTKTGQHTHTHVSTWVIYINIWIHRLLHLHISLGHFKCRDNLCCTFVHNIQGKWTDIQPIITELSGRLHPTRKCLNGPWI